MEKMGTTNSELEGLFEKKKRVKNPLVPIGTFSRSFCLPTHFCIYEFYSIRIHINVMNLEN